ncbi:MAG TPA: RagB/SusD family nutrient uptake outer membrane protein [Parafilimonas sp.]|nr:RagB/SusD family nutrient uptake outer membrane protein [Parafilimonas sp.]
MNINNKFLTIVTALVIASGCTKLNEDFNDSINNPGSGGNTDVTALLNNAYNDMNTPFNNQDQIFSLEENVTDECLVPTRGGDWDDNGVWRVLHAHSWDVTHQQAQSVFINLGKLESDATTVLAFKPSQEQAAEALFLRSLAQFYLLDLYAQVPYRTVEKYNSIDAAPVLEPAAAIDTLVANLTQIIPQLSDANQPYKASPNAARFLLMKVLLNKQAFLNRESPGTADNGDMTQIINLGNDIINSGTSNSATGAPLQFTPHYFDNFGPNNGGADPAYGFGVGAEMIFAFPNLPGVSNNNGRNSVGVNARWMMTLHYNSYGHPGDGVYGGAGWNGFSTIADFYNAFDASDTMRRGNVPYPGVTNTSGLKVGLLEGQQYDENGQIRVDRNGNPLQFNPEVHLVEPDPLTLEDNGIRIIKYAPDYQNYTGGQQGNQLQLFRLADVYLMMAEAYLNQGDAASALAKVNEVRAARKAAPLASLSLVNAGNLYDENTLLAERQKELYWESWRRQDLIRMGVYLQPWALKEADDAKYLLFPIPSTQLIVNPNLTQNPGY